MQRRHHRHYRNRRRGAAVVLTAVSLTVLLGFAALAIDVGMLYNVRTELQRNADSAALAGAWMMLDNDRLKGAANLTEEIAAAQSSVGTYAALNKVQSMPLTVPTSDILFGYLENPRNQDEQISTADPSKFNTVRVRVRRDSQANSPVSLWFGNIFGFTQANLSAAAAATFKDGVIGYKATEKTGNADLLPLALHIDAWKALLAKQGTVRDSYRYDEQTHLVSGGSDDIPELNLYPGAGTGQLPPGNFGTVDIGSSNNSTADLSRQIRTGVNEDDLAYFGGELKLGANGTLLLNGDTGLSAGIKDDLNSIKGQPRAIPLFNKVVGTGNNATFTIVGFAGIRILNVKLTGSMSSKEVIIQPAFVVDDASITGPGSGKSYFVYEPVHLVR